MPSLKDLPPFFSNMLRLEMAGVKKANNVYNVLFIQRETTSLDEEKKNKKSFLYR
jgi:hypothetical protein